MFYLLLIVILSVEATVGLPLFFTYLFLNRLLHLSNRHLVWHLFAAALFLAVFYSMSWPILTLFLAVLYFILEQLGNKLWGQILVFFIFNLLFFYFAKLHLNYYYLLHLSLFGYFFYKTNFKKYAT